jgi:hypothetical protein
MTHALYSIVSLLQCSMYLNCVAVRPPAQAPLIAAWSLAARMTSSVLAHLLLVLPQAAIHGCLPELSGFVVA